MPYQTNGGKNGSTFMQSRDDCFVIKEIKEEEFMSFKIIGSEYLDHIDSEQTCLNKAWGVYKLVAYGRIS